MQCLEWIEDELKEIRENKLFRNLTEIQSGQSPEVTIDGNKYILLASNSYLGLSVHPDVVAAARNALEKYGTGSGGSRLVSGSSDLHRELETCIADFKNTQSSILFSSGYLANIGTISSLVGPGDFIFSDELNHASIIDGCRLSKATIRIYPHLDYNVLEDMLKKDTDSSGKKLVVTDSVFSMDGDLADIKVLAAISEKYGAMLMVDEAHSTGVLGERGSGATEHFGIEESVPIVMGTLSKAVGSLGGYIAGDRNLIDFIRNRVRSYIFDTSLPAASLAASMTAIKIIREDKERRKHLWDLIAKFKKGLSETGLVVLNSHSAIVPVLIGEPEPTLSFASELRNEGIFTPAVRPPSVPHGKCRIRASLMATHSEEHITRAIEGFSSVKDKILL